MTATKAPAFAPGSFCWVELNHPDPAAAQAFYAPLLGWNATHERVGECTTYTTFDVGGRPVAAMQPLRDGAGPKPYWLNYLATDDVAAAAAKAVALGATLMVPPLDAMGAGRFAQLADPTGAVFALWEAGKHVGQALVDGEPGSPCWHDLYTPDTPAAGAFYAGLFGHTLQPMDIPGSDFTLLVSTEPEAGMCNPGGTFEAGWQPFFGVADCQATVDAAVKAGATVTCPPTDMGPRVFAHLVDPFGVSFGITQRK